MNLMPKFSHIGIEVEKSFHIILNTNSLSSNLVYRMNKIFYPKAMKKETNLISVCGLNCGECEIYLAPDNHEIAKRLVTHFYGMWDDVKTSDFSCSTCRGDRSECWTEECWIRECCIENKKLDFCFECIEFPCNKLIEWSKESEKYANALETLKKMKKNRLIK